MKTWIGRISAALLLAAMLLGLAACGSMEDLISEVIEEEISSLVTETGSPESTEAPETGSGEEETAPDADEESPAGPAETGDEPEATDPAAPDEGTEESGTGLQVSEDGVYDSKDEVALYIHLYGHLPSNYITKSKAESLGWTGGSLEPYAPGKCIGGGRFGNYEGLLPEKAGRKYTECDIGTMGKKSRGAKRIVFSNDGLIYYTDDHYESFTLLYGEEGS